MGNHLSGALSPFEIYCINDLYKDEIKTWERYKDFIYDPVKQKSFQLDDIVEHMHFSEDLDALYESSNMDKKYKPLPKFPAVTRDIALLVEDAILVQEIDETIRKAGGNLVEKVELFDIYKGKQVPEGKKSIAYAIAYRDENKTLKDEDVNKVHEKILRSLEYKLGATLRD